ncbi:contact-dependent growth inhibition system immunity protein [Actinoplanes sp. CA-015351]|uniref:contact-dependent growth inhibition system immunity protein n=1 Tax=Actinoplanes sp. CA-015351 TaxID=3239897 RepID=UPI003D9599F7
MATVHALRSRPIGELGTESLRLLISRQVGLAVLVPEALGVLEADPLAEGDFYPGDLLTAVLRVPAEHWAVHPDQGARLRAVLAAVDPAEIDDEVQAEIAKLGSGASGW